MVGQGFGIWVGVLGSLFVSGGRWLFAGVFFGGGLGARFGGVFPLLFRGGFRIRAISKQRAANFEAGPISKQMAANFEAGPFFRGSKFASKCCFEICFEIRGVLNGFEIFGEIGSRDLGRRAFRTDLESRKRKNVRDFAWSGYFEANFEAVPKHFRDGARGWLR